MKTQGKNGKDSATSSDNKRFLKIWYRFVKLGSRDFDLVGDPKEIRAVNVYRKLSATDMIPREDIKKVIDVCTILRDKALIDFAYDSGKRIGEVLNVKIKDIQVTNNDYFVKTDRLFFKKL